MVPQDHLVVLGLQARQVRQVPQDLMVLMDLLVQQVVQDRLVLLDLAVRLVLLVKLSLTDLVIRQDPLALTAIFIYRLAITRSLDLKLVGHGLQVFR